MYTYTLIEPTDPPFRTNLDCLFRKPLQDLLPAKPTPEVEIFKNTECIRIQNEKKNIKHP